MHATAQVVARVRPEIVEAIARVAKAEGVTRGEIVRQLIEVGLAARGVKLGKL